MKRKKTAGGRTSRPERRLPAEGDRYLTSWLPPLTHAALHRRAGSAFSLREDELHALGDAVRSLSRGFTGKRSLAGSPYLRDERSLAAYLLYYWPASHRQALTIFRRFPPVTGWQGASVLDLGGGPGPAACAAFDCGARRVTAADAARRALTTAGTLAGARGYPLKTLVWNAEKDGLPVKGRFDVIVFGHVLNELWAGHTEAVERRARLVEEAAGLLGEGGRIVIYEPALLATTRELLRLRDRLCRTGFSIAAPCLRQGPCPCLADNAGAAATCHADDAWSPPSWYVRLAHRARLGRESLRYSFLVLNRPGDQAPAAEENVFRVVSERMLSKSGRLRYMICNERGRFSLSAKPSGEESWLETFMRLRRYDTIKIDGAEERPHGLGLRPESRLYNPGL
jgi:SAM-dependent methyltransferase